jgi:hypothetical protein
MQLYVKLLLHSEGVTGFGVTGGTLWPQISGYKGKLRKIYIKKRIIICELAKTRRPKWATFVVHISEFRCPFG